jgi:hypothetical protein
MKKEASHSMNKKGLPKNVRGSKRPTKKGVSKITPS